MSIEPPFRYAIAGIEVGAFCYFSELDESLAEPFYDGLVVADSIWQKIGAPKNFVEFREGYRWQPFIRAK